VATNIKMIFGNPKPIKIRHTTHGTRHKVRESCAVSRASCAVCRAPFSVNAKSYRHRNLFLNHSSLLLLLKHYYNAEQLIHL